MTTAADDTADEAAFEAFLAGRPVPEEADGSSHAVAAFAGAVRATATLPGRPNAALADLLTTGLLTDQSSPSTRTAPSAGRSPRRSRVRRRRRFAMLFPALLAKFLSAGAVAQAASGAGICLVAFTGAGAAGVLPDPVQETFSSVVGTETAGETSVPANPTGTDTGTAPVTEVEDPALETPVVVAPTDLTLEDWAKGPAPDQSFGDWVSNGARHGYADGKTISEWAHARNEDRHGGAAESTPATGTDAPEAEDDHSTTESGSLHGGGSHRDGDDGGHDSGSHGGGGNRGGGHGDGGHGRG
jgi:hypothetical protein